MPRNGSGTYVLPKPPFTPGTTISSTDVNADLSDIATALTGSIAADGQTPISGQLKLSAGTASLPAYAFVTETNSGLYLSSASIVGIALDGVAGVLFDGTRIGTGQDGNRLTYGNGAIPAPVGRVTDFAGSTAPSGWLFIYGQNVSRTGYPELFTVIGTAYGSGDGSTTFGLPDGRGRVTAGRDDMGGSAASRLTGTTMTPNGTTLGAVGGTQTVVITTSTMAAHSHGISDPSHHHISSAGTAFAGSTTAAGASGGAFTAIVTPAINLAGTTTTDTATGISIDSAGSGNAHDNTQPTIIFNKIIFAGRP